jgi:NAD(P)-dependent dehydrogenase (short-subunit alcohol dehydrogenase family)
MGQIPGGAEGLGGQVALVTGGGRGIGRAISQGRAAAGASVAIVARSTDQIAETADRMIGAGGRAIACPADVSDGRALERMFEDVERAFGPVSLLVNNAGVPGPLGPVAEAALTSGGGAWKSTCGGLFSAHEPPCPA